MSERVERIERVGRVKAIRPYSTEEQVLKIKVPSVVKNDADQTLYVCKYCGKSFPSIQALASGVCPVHPWCVHVPVLPWRK